MSNLAFRNITPPYSVLVHCNNREHINRELTLGRIWRVWWCPGWWRPSRRPGRPAPAPAHPTESPYPHTGATISCLFSSFFAITALFLAYLNNPHWTRQWFLRDDPTVQLTLQYPGPFTRTEKYVTRHVHGQRRDWLCTVWDRLEIKSAKFGTA